MDYFARSYRCNWYIVNISFKLEGTVMHTFAKTGVVLGFIKCTYILTRKALSLK